MTDAEYARDVQETCEPVFAVGLCECGGYLYWRVVDWHSNYAVKTCDGCGRVFEEA